MANNLIREAQMQDVGFQLVNLQELDLRGNKIKNFSKLIGFPKVKTVVLDENPLTSIEVNAFRDCPDLTTLSI